MNNSRKVTGYVGLKNQGATCYLNSLVQTLFFIKKLRKEIFQIPALGVDLNDDTILALQRVFYNLQFGEKPVETKCLTRSFGWNSGEALVQHDAQELCRLLLSRMEQNLVADPERGDTISSLFEGQSVSYVRCRDVDYQSERVERFYDIQLNIKNKQDLLESFEEYCSSELLDGNNKYDAGCYGLQVAEKGVLFKSFPPVLHLHLLRFQYNNLLDANVKINDRFEFSEKLDLDQFLVAKEDTPAHYTLQAVLVHSQFSEVSGHYFVFIDPECKGNWLLFNDERVTVTTKQAAIENNFGGHPDRPNANAYMLVYIRDSMIPIVLQTVIKEDIPKQLLQRFEGENAQRQEELNESQSVPMRLIFEDCFVQNQGVDLIDERFTKSIVLNVPLNASIDDMRMRIEEHLGHASINLRLWRMSKRPKVEAVRPVLLEKFRGCTAFDLFTASTLLYIFVEFNNDPEYPLFENECQILIFFKIYNPLKSVLEYGGRNYSYLGDSLCQMVAEMKEMCEWDITDSVLCFKEISRNTIAPIDRIDLPFCEQEEEFLDGDIIIMQRLCENDISILSCSLPYVEDYFAWVSSCQEVYVFDHQLLLHPRFQLSLSKRSSLANLLAAVAEMLLVDILRLQLYIFDELEEQLVPVPYDYAGTLASLVPMLGGARIAKLAYEIMPLPITLAENKRQIKILLVNHELRKFLTFTVSVENSDAVSEILNKTRATLRVHEYSSQLIHEDDYEHLRVQRVSGCQVDTILPPSYSVHLIQPQHTLQVEVIPKAERNLPHNVALIPCCHVDFHRSSKFGIPFVIPLRTGDCLKVLRERVRQKLHIPFDQNSWDLIPMCDHVLKPLIRFRGPLRVSDFVVGEKYNYPVWVLHLGLRRLREPAIADPPTEQMEF